MLLSLTDGESQIREVPGLVNVVVLVDKGMTPKQAAPQLLSCSGPLVHKRRKICRSWYGNVKLFLFFQALSQLTVVFF